MEAWIEEILDAAGDQPGFFEFFLLGLAALLEYVVPPVPGDFVVLVGAFFVGAKGWSAPAFFLTVNLSSAVGFSIDYAVGVWIAKRDAAWRERYPRWRRLGTTIDKVERSFARWGAIYIACNRFLPALRAACFVAAGMAGVRYWKVLLWGLVSSLLWNSLIFLVGVMVGNNREELFSFFRTYSLVAWTVVAVAVIGWVLRWVLRWWLRARAA